MNRIRVMIVDDHTIVRMGLRSVLSTRREIEVVGDSGDGETAIVRSAKLRPDVVLMDLSMPGMDGAETTRRILAASASNSSSAAVSPSRPRILILTSFGTSNAVAKALASGASGAVIKTVDMKALIDAIRRTAAGERVISPEISENLELDKPVPELSPRQREVLELLAKGHSNSVIAEKLGISRAVVKEHEAAIYSKFGVANRTEAIDFAHRRMLIS